MDALPGHALGPLQHGLDIDELCAVPMLFENPPTALNGVVFAVVRRIVQELNRASDGVGEGHQTCQELGAVPMAFRTVVELDLELRDGVTLLVWEALPPLFQAVDEKVTGLGRVAEPQEQLCGVFIDDAKGGVFFRAAHVVIGGAVVQACLTASGVLTEVDRGFTVNTQAFEGAAGVDHVAIFGVDIGEDGVGFGNFFWGLALSTGRSR